MAKFMSFLLIVVVLTLFHQSTALHCHKCDPACEVSKAEKGQCGENIGNSQEAVCAQIFPQGKADSAEAIRKCLIANKGQDPACPAGSTCKFCKTEMCNAAPSIGANSVMVALVAACLAKFFVY